MGVNVNTDSIKLERKSPVPSMKSPLKSPKPSPRPSICSPGTQFSPMPSGLQKIEKKSPTYSAFACGVNTENEQCPSSRPLQSKSVSPGTKLSNIQPHIKAEPLEIKTEAMETTSLSTKTETANKKKK